MAKVISNYKNPCTDFILDAFFSGAEKARSYSSLFFS